MTNRRAGEVRAPHIVFNPLVFFLFFFLQLTLFFYTPADSDRISCLQFALRLFKRVYLYYSPDYHIVLSNLSFKLGHVCALLSHIVSRTCLI